MCGVVEDGIQPGRCFFVGTLNNEHTWPELNAFELRLDVCLRDCFIDDGVLEITQLCSSQHFIRGACREDCHLNALESSGIALPFGYPPGWLSLFFIDFGHGALNWLPFYWHSSSEFRPCSGHPSRRPGLFACLPPGYFSWKPLIYELPVSLNSSSAQTVAELNEL